MRTVRLFWVKAGVSMAVGLMPICLWFGIGLAPLLFTSGCGDESKEGGTQVERSAEVADQEKETRDAMRAENKAKREWMKKGTAAPTAPAAKK